MSSETGNAGSLLILADGMLVENPEDFYHMQVSGFADVSTWNRPVRPVGLGTTEETGRDDTFDVFCGSNGEDQDRGHQRGSPCSTGQFGPQSQ